MWIGKRQWEGLPGEFDVGQPGWVFPLAEVAELFIFTPVFASECSWSYRVSCLPEDFLRFTPHENVPVR